MTEKKTRRELSRAWRDQPANAGIYAFHGPQGAVWVDASPTLDKIENRLRFTLRMRDCRVPGLQSAWDAARGDGFRFEVLERFDPELTPMARETLTKARLAHWRAEIVRQAV